MDELTEKLHSIVDAVNSGSDVSDLDRVMLLRLGPLETADLETSCSIRATCFRNAMLKVLLKFQCYDGGDLILCLRGMIVLAKLDIWARALVERECLDVTEVYDAGKKGEGLRTKKSVKAMQVVAVCGYDCLHLKTPQGKNLAVFRVPFPNKDKRDIFQKEHMYCVNCSESSFQVEGLEIVSGAPIPGYGRAGLSFSGDDKEHCLGHKINDFAFDPKDFKGIAAGRVPTVAEVIKAVKAYCRRIPRNNVAWTRVEGCMVGRALYDLEIGSVLGATYGAGYWIRQRVCKGVVDEQIHQQLCNKVNAVVACVKRQLCLSNVECG